MLQLKKPLAFIDIEATGSNVTTDRIVEIAMIKHLPDGNKSVKRKLINPETTIPANIIEIHGITNEMVKDAPTFKQAAHEIKQFLDGCDLACYNAYRL
ncbi:MAG TPA: 3'-5' exonuclease, partial [Chitinophagaceae bacterium]